MSEKKDFIATFLFYYVDPFKVKWVISAPLAASNWIEKLDFLFTIYDAMPQHE